MKREEFLSLPEVNSFISWLIQKLPELNFALRFKSSKFVPNGLNVDVKGFPNLLEHYCWSSIWFKDANTVIKSTTWKETKASLNTLSLWLKSAIHSGNESQTLNACLQVLQWGGVHGAIPFLTTLAKNNNLSAYLRSTASLMSLESDVSLDDLHARSILRFDSGLTKIHALIDDTGSPIYDSRVGAAMGMLYCLFLAQSGSTKRSLAFPYGAARGDQIRNPAKIQHNLTLPNLSSISNEEWARWQLRLGWIIRAILQQTNWFSAQGTLAERCHAFEACLFTLGYDLRCFGLHPEAEHKTEPLARRPSQTVNTQGRMQRTSNVNWVPTSHPFSEMMQRYALFRNTENRDNQQSFIEWMLLNDDNARPRSRTTVTAYCYPFSPSEFDLYGRPLAEIERIAAGGRDGLCAVFHSTTLTPLSTASQRKLVCLVDAYITGIAYSQQEFTGSLNDHVLNAGYAGTKNAATVLLTVGRNVGKHFGLLDTHNMPTELFSEFFKEFSLSDGE